MGLSDVSALYLAFVLAYLVRVSREAPLAHHVSLGKFAVIVTAMSPLWVLIFGVCGLYSPALNHRRVAELARVLVAVAGGVMSLVVWDYLRPDAYIFPSRSVPVWAVPFGIVLVLLGRVFVRQAAYLCFARGWGLHNVIVVGTGRAAMVIADELTRRDRGYRIIASVDPRRSTSQPRGHQPVYRNLEEAVSCVDGRIDEILQTEADFDRNESARMMSLATRLGISYRFVPDQFGVYAAASRASTVAGIPVLELRLTVLDGWGAVVKRALDLILTVVLIVLLAPLLLMVALLVKVTDPGGPILYKQGRLGRYGREIELLKFRSMSWRYSTGPDREFKVAQEAFAAMGRHDLIEEYERDVKVADDPRVTSLGRFLRRTSLDELPQLLNVLAGDISLVGPRPVTAPELDRYGAQVASLLSSKPGITGLWQVSGRSDISYSERVKLDVFYVENWSILLDLTILARTVRAVTAARGAV